MKRLLVVCAVLALTLSFASPITLIAREGTVVGGDGICVDSAIQSRGPRWQWSTILFMAHRGQWRHDQNVEHMWVQTMALSANTWSQAIASNNNYTIRGSWQPQNEVSGATASRTHWGITLIWQMSN